MTDAGLDSAQDDRRLPALTGLRFVAALAVVVSHLEERSFIAPMPELVALLDGGRTAVSLFFVLSGFILAYNYRGIGSPGSARAFAVARVARIVPTVWLALGIACVGTIGALAQPEPVFPERLVQLLPVSFVAQALAITGWIPVASINQAWNGPAWSISCEVFFYVLFPAMMIALRDRSARVLAGVVLVAFVLQAVFVFWIAPLAPINQAGFLATQFPLPHLTEFVCGIVAAVAHARGARTWLRHGHRRSVLLVVALTPLLLLAVIRPLTPAYVPATPFFALLVLALAARPRRRSWLALPPLLLLGEASYALYLTHVPLLDIIAIWPVLRPFGWAWLVLLVFVSIGVFRLYESPARRLVKAWLVPEKRDG